MRGANNKVHLRIALLPDFLVMKAHALTGREKPKDAYDLCYCLEHFPDGMNALANVWKNRRKEKDVVRTIEISQDKFVSVDAFEPGQVVEFYGSVDAETQTMQARRAFELMQQFLCCL